MGLLPPNSMFELRELALHSGLAAMRDSLFFQIAAKDQLSVPGLTQDAQLTRDLDELNNLDEPTADGYLLAMWLRNAAFQLHLQPQDAARMEAWRKQIDERAAPAPAMPDVGGMGAGLQWQQEDLTTLANDANDLMLSKRLHDRLHMAQQLLPSFRAVMTLSIDNAALRPIARQQLKPFADIALGMSGELTELPPDNELAVLGTAMAGRVQEKVTAVDASLDVDGDAMKKALGDLRAEIKRQMEDMASRVEMLVRVLRLGVLIDRLRVLAANDAAYGEAVKTLTVIHQDLSSLSPQHRAWQNLDSLLWLAEDFFDNLAESAFIRASFESNWKLLCQGLETLAGDPHEPWYSANEVVAQKFIAVCPLPIAVPINPGAFQQLQDFLNVTRDVFYRVDLKLKTSCNRLGAITRQLAVL